ncbi:MAG: hypothetical protein RL722_1314 [Pseudomonadota bacterium]|jgi:hypothetical protein
MSDDFFAPPPFNVDEGLRRATRELRALGLAERAGVFELAGDPVIRMTAEASAIKAEMVREPMRSPQWKVRNLRHSGDVRDFIAEATKKIRDWKDEPDE